MAPGLGLPEQLPPRDEPERDLRAPVKSLGEEARLSALR